MIMKLNFFKSLMPVFLLGCVHLACAQSTYKWDANAWMAENGDYGIPVPDYVEENVSTKVVKIIQSYTGVVNKMVWRKF